VTNDRILDGMPEHMRKAVRVALSAVFGKVPVESHEPMSGGASGALAFRINVGGGRYALRVEVRRHPLRNPHQYKCMQLAVDAGIAPPLRYASGEAGVAIMDHIGEQPLQMYPGGAAMLARDSAALIAKLHATSLFPAVVDFRQLIRRILVQLRSGFSAGLLDAHEENFERIVAAYPWNAAAHVSSHNDPNPRNMLFDGSRLWLIDWETAYRNDALIDVAILAENHAPSAEEARTLLHAYLGRPPQPAQLAQLRLMRQLTRLYYAGLLLGAAVISAAPMESLAAPTPDAFRALIAAGKLAPGSLETKVTLGKMCLGAFASELHAPGYEESLASASQLA
jgi:aminoglycoside phosphotransferase (APT) family kinase protein